jgi:NADPH-dependent ferric siderophore reductase
MPQLPVFLAQPMARWFGHAVEVSRVEEHGAWLRRVSFAGEGLRGRGWRAGQEVEFHVGDGAFRHYTPSGWDAVAGRFEVVFHLHGRGPGSVWASGLRVGDGAHAMGPGGRFGLVAGVRHVLVGDETAIGVCMAMRAGVPTASACLLEVDDEVEVVRALVPGATVVSRGAERGEALAAALRATARAGDVLYLAGHAGTIQRLRKVWSGELGLPRSAVRIKAYWADGRRGM